jgi:hypothetical protein
MGGDCRPSENALMTPTGVWLFGYLAPYPAAAGIYQQVTFSFSGVKVKKSQKHIHLK